jgi:hypothetical protein
MAMSGERLSADVAIDSELWYQTWQMEMQYDSFLDEKYFANAI